MIDEMNEIVICKYCKNKTLYGEMIWLNGKCMCPKCYLNERAKEDSKAINSNLKQWRRNE